jgi:hypothetical protein
VSRTIEFGLGMSLSPLAQADELGGDMSELAGERVQEEGRDGENVDAGREHARKDDRADDFPNHLMQL